MKKASCARNLDSCFDLIGGLSSNDDFYKSLAQFNIVNRVRGDLASHYYYKPVNIEFMNSMVLQSNSLITSRAPSTKKKTRNFGKFMANTDDSVGLKKAKIFEEMGKRFLKNASKINACAPEYAAKPSYDMSNPNEPNLFSSTKSVKIDKETPSTPSFALRKDKC